jgi:predicted TIM-barrel fold metal-dependent hydrolase
LRLDAILAAELVRGKEIRPFDTHAHTGTDIDGTTRSSDEHVRDLEAVSGRSVVFPLCVTSGYEAENRRVVEECGRHPGRLVPFARLDPRVSAAGDAADALAGGARGFKLHPRSEAFGLEHPNVEAIVAVAAEAKAPVLIHAGAGVGSFGSTIVELAAGHRQCPIILAHAGISDLSWLSRVVPDQPNLFFDTAWIVPADLLALFALVPPGRILYGSDAPYMDIDLLMAITLRCAHFTGLAPAAIALVMGGQLEKLLAGEAPIDVGPAPGPAATALSPGENRVISLLSGAGGCMLGGGDPSQSLELARLALADDPASVDGSPSVLAELIEECRSPSPGAFRALILALTLAATPGLVSEVLAD